MSRPSQHLNIRRRETAHAVLGKNLVIARLAAAVTQKDLAEASGISRATIAQLETGCGDPRLSTIEAVAKALQLPAILLLMGLPEIQAIAHVRDQSKQDRPEIDSRQIALMRDYLGTGMIKDQRRAALIGALTVEPFSAQRLSRIAAAVFSALLPGTGTEIGAVLGEALAQTSKTGGRVEAAGVSQIE
jgi:transcriptional regulator with XRE-family HTH domain